MIFCLKLFVMVIVQEGRVGGDLQEAGGGEDAGGEEEGGG